VRDKNCNFYLITKISVDYPSTISLALSRNSNLGEFFGTMTLDMADNTFIFKCILSAKCHITVLRSILSFLIIHIFPKGQGSPLTICQNSQVIFPTFAIHLPLATQMLSRLNNLHSSKSWLWYYFIHGFNQLCNIYQAFIYALPAPN
jgi:hypothetical protein